MARYGLFVLKVPLNTNQTTYSTIALQGVSVGVIASQIAYA